MNAAATASPFRFHGGRLAAAAAYFNSAPAPWIDLSTGISPWAYPVPDMAPSVLSRLPEPEELGQLEVAAARAFGVTNPEEVVAVPGSDIAIRLLGSLFPGEGSAMLTPIYSGHTAAWPDAVPISMAEADNYDLLILANPNNPDGRVIKPDRLRQLRGQLIVDEAFADTDPVVSLVPERGNAIVLRSFGKFFGLAGIRLGFVVADLPVVQRLRALLGDWPVSGIAMATGLAAYQDEHWQDKQRTRLRGAVVRLDGLLKSVGFEVVGGTSLFRLTVDDKSPEIFEYLGQLGILVRPFEANDRQLRFGLPANEEAWNRLTDALNYWRANQ